MRKVISQCVRVCLFLGFLIGLSLQLERTWASATSPQTQTLPCPPNPLTPAESTIGCGVLVPGGPSIGLAGSASGNCDNTTKCCRWDFLPTCECSGCESLTCTYGGRSAIAAHLAATLSTTGPSPAPRQAPWFPLVLVPFKLVRSATAALSSRCFAEGTSTTRY